MENETKIKQIYLITTEGCEACSIMKRIIEKVHKDNLYTFSVIIQDFNDVPEFIKTDVILTDFPTTVFVINKTIKYHFSGTTSADKLQEIIKDLNFN